MLIHMIRVGLLLTFFLWSGLSQAALYYRYTNNDGQLVIGQSVPAEFAALGYEVLNAQGRVIKVVPRALTEEELAAREAHQERQREKADQLLRDRKLLNIFSSPEDAERARDRKLEALDVYINVTQGNIIKLKNDYSQAQAQAAQLERAGEKVPQYLLDKLTSLSRQMDKAKQSIAQKEQEKDQIRAEYQKDVVRLRELSEQRRLDQMSNDGRESFP